jgi:hypothetical protein
VIEKEVLWYFTESRVSGQLTREKAKGLTMAFWGSNSMA